MRFWFKKNSYIHHCIVIISSSIYKAIGVFVLLFAILEIGGNLYISKLTQNVTNEFNSGILNDMEHLKYQGDDLANNSELQEYVLAKDSENLTKLTKQEIQKRNIGLMGVTDSNGVLLSRTKSVGNLGNNVFLLNPVARLAGQGKKVQSIEATVGFDPRQIFLNTGRPIINNNKIIGVLTANYLTDDEYALNFSKKYLQNNTQLVFYNKNAGVYGNSFTDPEIRKIINSYFNTGSDWLQNGLSDKTVTIDNKSYFVKNIVFPGLEKSPGGALLFIPRQDYTILIYLIVTFITLYVFLYFAIRKHQHEHKNTNIWKFNIIILIISLIICLLSLSLLHIQNIRTLKLTKIPNILYNSTLRIQPEFGIYSLGYEQKFSIFVETGDEEINAVKMKLHYNPVQITINRVETSSSTCEYVIQNSIDSLNGEVNLTCGTTEINPTTGTLLIADLLLTPKKIGNFSLIFDTDETKVLAKDGLGTNVLRYSQSGSYNVDNFSNELFSTKSKNNKLRNFVVFSPTHPNQTRWYNSSSLKFVWLGPVGTDYIYKLDNTPLSAPTKKNIITGSELVLNTPGDGI